MSIRLLVVDDDVQSLLLLEIAFRHDDFQVISSRSPEEALAIVQTEPVDVVVTDYRMPRMNGAEFIAALRALPGMENVPIIVVSAHTAYELRAEKLPVSGFLLKPVHPTVLRAAVRDLLAAS